MATVLFSIQHMTPTLRFRVIYEETKWLSIGISFFAPCPWPRPLAQNWHARSGFGATDTSIFMRQDHMPTLSRQGRPLTGGLSVSFDVAQDHELGLRLISLRV
jgi:hypothetical protein